MVSELETELELLSSALEEKRLELRDIIKEEKQRKEAELQVTKHLNVSILLHILLSELFYFSYFLKHI